MFDFLRNLTKSAEEKQQEALNAYLDDALSPQERRQFEHLLVRDADLRLEVEQRRALQMQMRQMPRRRVPRNFTLDPALYGRPQRQPLFQLYPVMQAAAVLTAIFFILAIGVDIFLYQGSSTVTSGAAPDIAMLAEEAAEEPAAETPAEAPLAAQAVEVTRIVTETVVEEGEAAPPVEAPAAEPAAEEMVEATALATEEEMPAEETMTTAANAAEADEQASEESAAFAPLPTPSPAATETAPAFIDATKSTVPRPEAETITGERALTAVATAVVEVQAAPTAVPTPPPTSQPISGLRLLQIGLGVLLVVLGTAVFYVRRQS